VDAKEQLRRYLEQRRDMGETELVLDGMTVEETLRILGATAAVSREADRRDAVPAPRAVEREVVERQAPVATSGDWRET